MSLHVDSLLSLSAAQRNEVLAGIDNAVCAQILYDWHMWARPEQLPPPPPWRCWLILAGRGFGKTRTGAEWVRAEVAAGRAKWVALIGETAADVRDVMIEGESGLLSAYPPGAPDAPLYEPSKRRVTWPCGAMATCYSGDSPDQLRGPQHDLVWADEPAKWKYAQRAWDMMEFGLRLGEHPRVCATTTPRPIGLIRELMKDTDTVVSRGSIYDNADHLSAKFVERMRKRYEGTTLGRQELHAEIIEDVEGALWSRAMIENARVLEAPTLGRVVVAIDPAVTSGEDSDETGIVVAGRDGDDFYVLDDQSVRASPDQWARRAIVAYYKWKADRIIGEANNGGDMIELTLRTIGPDVAYKKVTATRGKRLRAEPIAALYEQGRVHHVGTLAALEDQQCTWCPGMSSPDRLDALVWALTELSTGRRGGDLGITL